jgi:ferric-chelate reductase [NAD(P)H]
MFDASSLFSMTYGLYIISAKSDGRLYGCIINSAVQTSAEPPSLAVSTNDLNRTTKAILDSGRFAVSILNQDADMKLIGRFGFRTSEGFDKFEGQPVIYTASGLPILSACVCAYVECLVAGSRQAHTHKIIFGDVVEAARIDAAAAPLTYDYYHKVIKGKTPKNAVSYASDN